MDRLRPHVEAIEKFVSSGKPLLGICLGQQLLFDGSDEHGTHQGLGLIPGWVKYFPPDLGVKVPHIGWNKLTYSADSWLSSIDQRNDQVYFVHSLYTVCENPRHVAATCEYGLTFAAAVSRDNVWGTQFHPERAPKLAFKFCGSLLNADFASDRLKGWNVRSPCPG